MAEKTTLLPILNRAPAADFQGTLRQHGLGELRRRDVTTLQINVGKLCNQACHHCHVEAGPKRTEIMPATRGGTHHDAAGGNAFHPHCGYHRRRAGAECKFPLAGERIATHGETGDRSLQSHRPF